MKKQQKKKEWKAPKVSSLDGNSDTKIGNRAGGTEGELTGDSSNMYSS